MTRVTLLFFTLFTGHPNTKMFLSHGGLNGLHEAAWYGLPVIGIPLFADHFDNIQRAQAKGMALKLDLLTLNEDVLFEAITRVIKEPRYYKCYNL